MEIRPVKSSEFEALAQIYIRSFFMLRERMDIYPFIREDMDLSRTRAIFKKDQIVSALQIIPFQS